MWRRESEKLSKKILVLAKLECCHLSNKQTSQKLLKEINYKIPKERERTLKESTIKQDLKRKNCEKEKDKYFHGDAAR